MPFQPTVFGQLMKPVPRRVFAAATTGRCKWGLSEWAHFVTLVCAQLAGTRSIRDLLRLLEHHRPALAHLGVGPVRRATLSDANATRPTAPFEAVAAALCGAVAHLAPGLGREARRLIDATRIHAGKAVRHWAVDGALKLHLVFDPIANRTTCFAVTSARVNDVTAAKRFPIEPGVRYVFDKGYYCFAFWAKLAAAGCQFVTRLKTNTPVRIIRTRRLPKAAPHVLKDQIGYLPKRLAASRKNPFAQPVRLVTVEISTGRVLVLLTNDLTAPATDIAALYKSRWEVELFFKWIKQNLKLHHFLGTSRNAVTLQVIAALIAHLLVRLAQLQGRSSLAAQALFRLFALTLFQHRPLRHLLHEPPATNTQPSRQLTPALAHG
ncbi:MAG: IS4 family transposase [Acetobacteraceae bacterium]|nr:IS4 family transposase [Acetobacteraceae bacterium]